MPKYRATLEISVDGNDVDCLYHAVDQLRGMDGVEVTRVSPCEDNPVDYPFEDEEGDWGGEDYDDEDYDDEDYDDEEDDDYWSEEEDGVHAP